MDADDIAPPDRLESQVAILEREPDLAVVGGAVEFIDANSRSLQVMDHPAEDQEIKLALQQGCAIWHATVLMRNSVFRSVGGYRKIVTDAEDYDLWLRISERFRLANLPKVVLKYRVHPEQVSSRKCRQQAISALAASAAADARRHGRPDPLDSVPMVSEAALTDLGMTQRALETGVGVAYRRWIRYLSKAGAHGSALSLAQEALRSFRWNDAENWVIGNLRALVAELYWHERNYTQAVGMGVRALITRPKLLGRCIKPLLNRVSQYRSCTPAANQNAFTQPGTGRRSEP